MEEQNIDRPDKTAKRKDWWDKSDIILKSMGSVLTALAVTGVGFFGSQYLDRRQDIETNLRLYTELMSRREEADSSLRKDMFNNIIKDFLKPSSTMPEQQVLNLELLTYNFHESLELGPLFKDIYRKISHSHPPIAEDEKERLLKRLKKVTQEVKDRQVAALERAGSKLDGGINLSELLDNPEGIKAIDGTIPTHLKANESSDRSLQKQKNITVTVLSVNHERIELRVKLLVGDARIPEVDVVFWVGFFSFPMLDNTRLPDGNRCAVVLRQFDESGGEISNAEMTLIYFPASRTSLKDKPYYDEVIQVLLRARRPAN